MAYPECPFCEAKRETKEELRSHILNHCQHAGIAHAIAAATAGRERAEAESKRLREAAQDSIEAAQAIWAEGHAKRWVSESGNWSRVQHARDALVAVLLAPYVAAPPAPEVPAAAPVSLNSADAAVLTPAPPRGGGIGGTSLAPECALCDAHHAAGHLAAPPAHEPAQDYEGHPGRGLGRCSVCYAPRVDCDSGKLIGAIACCPSCNHSKPAPEPAQGTRRLVPERSKEWWTEKAKAEGDCAIGAGSLSGPSPAPVAWGHMFRCDLCGETGASRGAVQHTPRCGITKHAVDAKLYVREPVASGRPTMSARWFVRYEVEGLPVQIAGPYESEEVARTHRDDIAGFDGVLWANVQRPWAAPSPSNPVPGEAPKEPGR